MCLFAILGHGHGPCIIQTTVPKRNLMTFILYLRQQKLVECQCLAELSLLKGYYQHLNTLIMRSPMFVWWKIMKVFSNRPTTNISCKPSHSKVHLLFCPLIWEALLKVTIIILFDFFSFCDHMFVLFLLSVFPDLVNPHFIFNIFFFILIIIFVIGFFLPSSLVPEFFILSFYFKV